MTLFDPATMERSRSYRLLIGSVVPRPIAWVTTVDANGVVNLAPFSFFNGITATPMTISIAIAYRDPIKDTLRNLRSGREAVVHIAPPSCLTQLHQSGADYAHSVSEVAELGLQYVPAHAVAPPRLTCCPIAMECRLAQEIPVGNPATTLCLLEVLYVHVDDSIADADGLPDPPRHQALARLGNRSYLSGDWPVVAMAAQTVQDGKGLPPRG
jgi:flavin reductase (DIM6/NTAB) family NADH-FMN oxidoreductase RutF